MNKRNQSHWLLLKRVTPLLVLNQNQKRVVYSSSFTTDCVWDVIVEIFWQILSSHSGSLGTTLTPLKNTPTAWCCPVAMLLISWWAMPGFHQRTGAPAVVGLVDLLIFLPFAPRISGAQLEWSFGPCSCLVKRPVSPDCSVWSQGQLWEQTCLALVPPYNPFSELGVNFFDPQGWYRRVHPAN